MKNALKLCLLAGLLWQGTARAVDNYVQSVCNFATSGVVTVSITGVVASNTLLGFAYNGNSATTPPTVGDGQNATWPAKGAAVLDATNLVAAQVYELDVATSGTHTVVTNSLASGGFLCVVEVTTTATTPFSDAKGQHQAAPGTGAGALSTTSITVTSASTLVSLSTDTSIVNVVDEPTNVSGTSRNSGTNVEIGSWRLQSQAASTSASGTFTAIIGTDDFVTMGVAIKNANSGAVQQKLALLGVGP